MKLKIILFVILAFAIAVSSARSDDIDNPQETKNFQTNIGSRMIGVSELLKSEANGAVELTKTLGDNSNISPKGMLDKTLKQSIDGNGSILVLETLKELNLTENNNRPSEKKLSDKEFDKVITTIQDNVETLNKTADDLYDASPKIYNENNSEGIKDIVSEFSLPAIAHNVLNAPPTIQISLGNFDNDNPTVTTEKSLETQIISKGSPYTTNFAAVALLDIDGSAICTDTLVHEQAIITSAHCFCHFDENVSFDVGLCKKGGVLNNGRAGRINAFFQQEGQIAVKKVTLHPDYDAKIYDQKYDLALLELESPVNNIEPAKLTAESLSGANATMIGYGLAFDLKNSDTVGLKGKTDVLVTPCNSSSHCSPNDYLFSSFSDAGTAKTAGIGRHCPGDSGGAIVADFSYQPKLIGVISSGSKNSCDGLGQVGVMKDTYLNKNKVNWIISQTNAISTVPASLSSSKKAEPFDDPSYDGSKSEPKELIQKFENTSFEEPKNVNFPGNDEFITVAVNSSVGKSITKRNISLVITDDSKKEICNESNNFTEFCIIKKTAGLPPYHISIQGIRNLAFQLSTTHFSK